MKVLYSFVSDATIIELEQEIKFKTAELRRNYRIKLPDAIIAATAQVYNLTLITNNTKDFISIVGLRVVNPVDVN